MGFILKTVFDKQKLTPVSPDFDATNDSLRDMIIIMMDDIISHSGMTSIGRIRKRTRDGNWKPDESRTTSYIFFRAFIMRYFNIWSVHFSPSSGTLIYRSFFRFIHLVLVDFGLLIP